jgi:hypothetical protein
VLLEYQIAETFRKPRSRPSQVIPTPPLHDVSLGACPIRLQSFLLLGHLLRIHRTCPIFDINGGRTRYLLLGQPLTSESKFRLIPRYGHNRLRRQSVHSTTEWLRAVRFEGKNHCPVEASTRIRLLIYTGTPTQINSQTLVTPAIIEDIFSYTKYNYCAQGSIY